MLWQTAKAMGPLMCVLYNSFIQAKRYSWGIFSEFFLVSYVCGNYEQVAVAVSGWISGLLNAYSFKVIFILSKNYFNSFITIQLVCFDWLSLEFQIANAMIPLENDMYHIHERVLHPEPKISMPCALSQSYQQLFKSFNFRNSIKYPKLLALLIETIFWCIT